jgi:aromatic amino acid aminotransferase I / 2-aminoadipate transaminase
MNEPGMISLAGGPHFLFFLTHLNNSEGNLFTGNPHPSLFPYNSLHIQVYSPEMDLSPEATQNVRLVDLSILKYPSPGHPNNLSAALQYGATFYFRVRVTPTNPAISSTGVSKGSQSLSSFLYNFISRVFRPAYTDFEILLHFGSTDAWNKVVNLLCEAGDYILVEEHTYTSAQAVWAPMGCKGVPIHMDKNGIIPKALESILGGWKERYGTNVKRPRLYVSSLYHILLLT